jgi:beta-galactosidase
MKLPYAVADAPQVDLATLAAVTLTDGTDAIVVGGKGFQAIFSRASGTLSSLVYDGVEMIHDGHGPRLNLYRARVGTATGMRRDVERAGLRDLTYAVKDVSAEQPSPGIVRVRCTVDCAGRSDSGMVHVATFTVFGNATIDVVNQVQPYGNLSVLPKLGVSLALPKGFDTLTWLGRGPHESYVDRWRSADVGLYHGSVAEQYERYVRPQENGNKTEVRWAALTDRKNKGLLVVTDGTYSISAHHNTAADFDEARHIHRVLPRDEVYLCIDAAHMGLGGASCGPRPLNEYILSARSMRFRYGLRPATKDLAAEARIRVPNLEAPLVTRDRAAMVRIESSMAGRIEYRLSGQVWKSYAGPFEHAGQGTLETRAKVSDELVSDTARFEMDAIVPMRELNKSAWKVVRVSSVEPGEGEVRHAFDGDPATFWHTNWSSTQDRHPHEIQIDLGQTVEMLGFTQLPRQDQANGRIRRYEFYVSDDGTDWGEPVVKAEFPNNDQLQTVIFAQPVKGRYIRLAALNEWGVSITPRSPNSM